MPSVVSPGSSVGRPSPAGTRILVLQLTRVGDLLQTTPLLSGLRENHPDAFIALLANKRFEKAVAGNPDIDEVILLDADFLAGWQGGDASGIVSGYRTLTRLCRSLRALRFDRVINASFNDVSATIARLVAAPHSSGFLTRSDGLLDAPDFVSRYFHSQVQSGRFPQLHVCDILQCLGGVPPAGRPLKVRAPSEDLTPPVLKTVPVGKRVVAIQPGSNSSRKGLPPDWVAACVERLTPGSADYGLILGSHQEKEIFEAIRSLTSAPILNATGLDWEELGLVLRRSSLLVSGDTGPLHYSTALGTPVLAIFREESHFSATGPYGIGHHVLDPPEDDRGCLPPVERVADAVRSILAGEEPASSFSPWKLYCSRFGTDGWVRYESRGDAPASCLVHGALLEYWKNVLMHEIGVPHAPARIQERRPNPDEVRELDETLQQADTILQEIVHGLSRPNGNDFHAGLDLLQRLAERSPGGILSSLLDLTATERSLIFEKDPRGAQEGTLRSYTELRRRIAEFGEFIRGSRRYNMGRQDGQDAGLRDEIQHG